jgi:hypothetical protein
MSWTPTITLLTPRAIPVNLLTYATHEDRQEEALEWAGNRNLKIIREFSKSIANRAIPMYPSVAFQQDDDALGWQEDLAVDGYSTTFEFSVQNSDADTAVENSLVYHKAFCSMFANCPTATLLAGTGATSATLQTIETSFDVIKTNEQQNDFLQQFQVRLTYALWE